MEFIEICKRKMEVKVTCRLEQQAGSAGPSALGQDCEEGKELMVG